MAKVVKFPIQPPEKFGFRPVRKKREEPPPKTSQLNLFTGGKVVKLNQLSAFEEALLLDEREDKAAKVHYLKAIKEGDSVPDAYCNLGIIESKLRNFPKAIDAFTLSLKEDPRHFESHYNLANLYAELGNLPLAKVHYQTSISIEPEFPNSYFNLGLTLAMNQEIDEAIKTLLEYRRLTTADDHNQVDELIEYLMRNGR
ncbi:MAG: tetratricopeptide repeat protein [Cyclobacteriaceae bacterium]|nr:tetratricopeptide repeat protein [Cyclobacteriaceae bacterium]